MEKFEFKHFEKITEDLVDLFKLLNADMNSNSPLRMKYSEDCFHDLHDMTDAFIAYHGKQPVGCTILKYQSKEVGVVTNIYVAPEFRRSGLCYEFFRLAEAQARKRGHLLLTGDTWNELGPMQKAFLNGGYTEYKVAAENDEERAAYDAGHNYWKLLV